MIFNRHTERTSYHKAAKYIWLDPALRYLDNSNRISPFYHDPALRRTWQSYDSRYYLLARRAQRLTSLHIEQAVRECLTLRFQAHTATAPVVTWHRRVTWHRMLWGRRGADKR